MQVTIAYHKNIDLVPQQYCHKTIYQFTVLQIYSGHPFDPTESITKLTMKKFTDVLAINNSGNDDEPDVPQIDDRWWKANLDYLPIHFFQKHMKKVCVELHELPSRHRTLEICEDISRLITTSMHHEILSEYSYYYDKGIIETKESNFTQCGYLEYLKHVLTKLVRLYLNHRDEKILEYIFQFHGSWFNKPRYWDDYELDHIDTIVSQLRSK